MSNQNAHPNAATTQSLGDATQKTAPTLLGKKNKVPAYMQSLNQQEKAENFKILDNMNKKISYRKNPRFKINKAPIIFTKAGQGSATDKENPFRVEPQVVQFSNYQVNGIYEIPLRIINGSETLQRIKISPPSTQNFTIKDIVYPSSTTGDVASGLGVTISVNFVAPSFADFDDFITVVTENNSFKVPVRARRDPPLITLANPMNCLHSWVGDRVDMAFRCVNSGGDGGFKFFCEKDEDDQRQIDPNILKIGAFSLSPSQFYLHAGAAVDIYVSFTPVREGQTTENLILACDNNTSESFQVTGNGAMLDVEIIEVDGRPINFKVNPFSTLQFPNTNPTAMTQRKIKVKNISPILVPFHWSIFKNKNSEKISLEDEHTHYKIEPIQGKIQANQIQEFMVSFSPEHAEPYFEYCDLIMEDLPIQCVRDPPEGLRHFVETAKKPQQINSKVPMPHYVGSNTQFLSVPLFSFSLIGQGNSCEVTLDPPLLSFEGDLFINQFYKKTLKLKKEYKGTVFYKISLEGKSSDILDVDVITQGRSLKALGVIESKIKEEDEIELEVQFMSRQTGEQNAFFYVEIADGAPISFQVKGSFRGPIIRIIEPVINFGLVKVNTLQKYRMTIENCSPISTEILLKSCRNADLSFATANSQRILRKFRDTKTLQGNSLRFMDSPEIVIQANSRVEVLIQLDAKKPESFDEFFEIIAANSENSSLFYQVIAEIQKPMVTLNKELINLGRIYAGVPEKIDRDSGERHIILSNFGNIPAQFNWEEKYEMEKIIARFEPIRGVIPPKSEVKINVQFLVYYGGKVDELLVCNIEDMEIPLGIEVHAESYGLNVVYETNEPINAKKVRRGSSQLDQTLTNRTGHDSVRATPDIMNQSATSRLGGDSALDDSVHPSSHDNSSLISAANIMRYLKFTECIINKPTSQKFVLKNTSGIKTRFKFHSLKFEPLSHEAPKVKSEIEKAREEQLVRKQRMNDTTDTFTQRGSTAPGGNISSVNNSAQGGRMIRFAPSTKSGATHSRHGISSAGQEKREKPILTDEHEATQKFSSKTGTTFTMTKKFEKDANYFLSNNKGIAIVFIPQMGELPPHSEIPITVMVYNNVCGRFDDKLISEVRGLVPVEFPVSIAIKGSPVEIPGNQVGLSYGDSIPLLPMPTQVVKTQPVQKQFKVRNTGIRAIEVDWKIFDQDDLDNSETNFFKINVGQNPGIDKAESPFKLNFTFIEPEESKNSVYNVEPKTSILGPRETQNITVTFYPNKPGKGPGKFKTTVIATPSLSKDELAIAEDAKDFAKKGSLGVVAFKILAECIDPMLTIDKRTRVDGLNHMSFKYWSYRGDEDTPSAIQRLIYTNDTKTDMVFNLTQTGPFEIVKTKTNTNAFHPNAPVLPPSTNPKKPQVQTFFCLQPLKILEIQIKFKAPNPSNTQDWPMIIKKDAQGEIFAHFINGDQQRMVLDAHLLRPMMMLLTDKPQKNDKAQDELDFGIVHVDGHRTIRVFLSNETDVTAKWGLNYVKFPKKSTIGYMTKTAWENENLEKLDDPDVFEFSITEGSLKGKSLPLRKIPEGLCVPPLPKDEEQKKYLPQTVLINFRPKKNVLYKSKFRFVCENGLPCDVILKGHGSYEENYA